jgi:hypothetical protein
VQAVEKELYISGAQVSDWAPSGRIGNSVTVETAYCNRQFKRKEKKDDTRGENRGS